MITIEQAIELARQAYEGQWRKAEKTMYSPKIQRYENYVNEYGNLMTLHETAPYWRESKPYITHPLAVMEMMDTEEEKIIAVLHDVVENTSAKLEIVFGGKNSTITYNNIVYELPLTIALTLHKLTHTNEESYMDYIQKVATGKLATKVKLADIVCNLADSPSEHAKQKYFEALPILLKAL